MADFDDAVELSSQWPEVTEELFYGTPGLKVRGKGFARLWGERDFSKADVTDTDVLVLFCEMADKADLLLEHPDVLFDAPHYRDHGAVLVRLTAISRPVLGELLYESYLLKAPPAGRRTSRHS